ncbi:MAG: STAS domain-containing protein [Candidatus Acidiferrales bacterium]
MTKDLAYRSARGFRVNSYAQEGATVVECHGKLTAENAPLLKSEVREMIPNQKRIILDLKEVPLMDSSGLGTIVGLFVSARTRRCSLELINANKQIRELFGISNLLSLFEAAGRHGGKMM